MNRLRILCSALLTCFLIFSYAQDTRNVGSPKPPRPQYQAFKKEKKGLFAFLKKKDSQRIKTVEEERIDFRKRMKKVNKAKIKEQNKIDKMERKTDGYFGHKRPPRKRPPGKQKFCKVCKIKH